MTKMGENCLKVLESKPQREFWDVTARETLNVFYPEGGFQPTLYGVAKAERLCHLTGWHDQRTEFR